MSERADAVGALVPFESCWMRGRGVEDAGELITNASERTRFSRHEERVVPTGEIKALSGLRIVAAVWVVLFHFRPLLAEAAPGFRSALAPVLDCGAQGVDLFFILSGFVLTWNYLDRMGDSWSWRSHTALPVAATVAGVARLSRHDAPGRGVDHLHAQRRPRSVGGRQSAHRDELGPAGFPGPAVVPALLRRIELGRTGLVDQRGVAGLPAVRGTGAGHLPDSTRDEGPGPDLCWRSRPRFRRWCC